MAQVRSDKFGQTFFKMRNGARCNEFQKRTVFGRFILGQTQQRMGCMVTFDNDAVWRDGQNTVRHVMDNGTQAGLVIAHLLFGLAQFAKRCRYPLDQSGYRPGQKTQFIALMMAGDGKAGCFGVV